MDRSALEKASRYFGAVFHSKTSGKVTGKVVIQNTTEEAVEAAMNFIRGQRLPLSQQELPLLAAVLKLSHVYAPFLLSYCILIF